jgi:hypothetical protein
MATSPILRLTLQDFNTNANSWGQILNDSALQLLEDATAGTASIILASTADYTLSDNDGSTAEARYMVLGVGGTTGGPTNVIVPTRSKVYLLSNTTGDDIVVKTAAGTGPTIVDGEAQWVFCDGTNVLAASAATATSAGTAALATTANELLGIAGTEYAQKGVAQTFTKGQVVQRQTVTTASGNLTINCADGNAFYLVTTETFTLLAPTNATNGQQFTLAIQQGGGGPHTIAFAGSTFIAANGTAPELSTVAGDTDYLAFEYVTGLAAPFSGNRWLVSIIKDLGDI